MISTNVDFLYKGARMLIFMLNYGTISKIYADNMPTHIRFDISRFSRFQIVSIEKAPVESPWTWILFCAAGFVLLLALLIILAIHRKRSAASRQI